jgi:hydrogenase maturation factor HypE
MLYWMPTTGEFGPGSGFGDYEYHEKLATLLGVHFTYSREDAQEQPGVNAFENSQIRLRMERCSSPPMLSTPVARSIRRHTACWTWMLG